MRIQFENLFRVATVGRRLTKAFCVGSVPPELNSIWKRLQRDTGVRPELYERGKDSGTEQGIDQCLQVWMLRCLHDVKPQVAILLTGDGAGYQEGAGFHADLERMHKAGWGIEVVSWERSCAQALKKWASEVGAYVNLEDYLRVGHVHRRRTNECRPQPQAPAGSEDLLLSPRSPSTAHPPQTVHDKATWVGRAQW